MAGVEGEGRRVQGGPRVPKGGGGRCLVCKMDVGKGKNGPYVANQYRVFDLDFHSTN